MDYPSTYVSSNEYDLSMAKLRYTTVHDLASALDGAGRPSHDDVTVLNDGTRIDSRQAALTWLHELNSRREIRSE